MLLIAEINTEAGVWVLVALVGAVGGWYLNYLNTRRTLKAADRKDALTEWQGYAAKLEARADRLQERADLQEKTMYELQKDWAECEKRDAQREGEIKLLRSDLRRMQEMTGDTAPGTVQPVIITATTDGMMWNVSPSASPMLHWLPQELQGKNVRVLIPERLLPAHQKALAEVVDGKRTVDPARGLETFALTRNGVEIAVIIHLSSWTTPEGRIMLNAEISRRKGVPDRPAGRVVN